MTIILTKTAKFMLIGSLSALLSFIAKFHPQVKLFCLYLYGLAVFTSLLIALWEGRKVIENQSVENELTSVISTFSNSKLKREYLLSPVARLELIVGLAIVTACLLIGAM